jgi:GntR family transcriptional regulator
MLSDMIPMNREGILNLRYNWGVSPMIRFNIQLDSDIPASTQLYNQILFAIASRQFPPGHRLPSTRQLAMQTGLHRNTVSKVYRQLEEAGLVDAQAGSGIYVRNPHHEEPTPVRSPLLDQFPNAFKVVQHAIEELMTQGCSLSQIQDLFSAEIDWRLRCSASVLVTAPTHDIQAGEILLRELKAVLKIPTQLVPLEELGQVLDKTRSGTVVTNRYFSAQAEAIAGLRSVRVIPLDLYDFSKEIQLIQSLPKGSCLGIVGLSAGTLGVAEVIIHSLIGDKLLVMSAQVEDAYKLAAIVRSAHTIISDQTSLSRVKASVQEARQDIIRPPQIICSENFVSAESIELLQRELGLDP